MGNYFSKQTTIETVISNYFIKTHLEKNNSTNNETSQVKVTSHDENHANDIQFQVEPPTIEQPQTVEEQTIEEEKTVEKQTIEEQTIEEQTIEEQTIEEQTIDEEKTVEEQTIDEEKTVEEQTIEEQTIDDEQTIDEEKTVEEEQTYELNDEQTVEPVNNELVIDVHQVQHNDEILLTPLGTPDFDEKEELVIKSPYYAETNIPKFKKYKNPDKSKYSKFYNSHYK